MKKEIRLLSQLDLATYINSIGEPKFRASQIYDWIWKKNITHFDQIKNVPKSVLEKLKTDFVLNAVQEHSRQISKDKTIKFVFTLHDGANIEGVLIPTSKRMTACVSSQVGCSLDCKFCATGYLQRVRNLTSYEIVDQVVLINNVAKEIYGIPLSNIVYMGMGEPLLNYKNVVDSIRTISSPDALGMSPKRITVSTAGIAKMIEKLADEGLKNHLALSLHAANNIKRSAIMPINESNDLESLSNALIYWYKTTGIRPTLEYCVIENINAGEEEAHELVRFAKQFPCKINLIEYNAIEKADFRGVNYNQIDDFAAILEENNLIVNIRRSRGRDIDAACGQLAGKIES